MLFEKGLRDFTKCQSFCTDNEDNVGALPRHFPENSPANNAENSPVNNAKKTAQLILSQTTNFTLFQTERVCRRQFQI